MPTEIVQQNFQPYYQKLASNQSKTIKKKQSVILQEAHIPHEARGKLSSFFENEFDSITSESSTDVGRTILFEINIPTSGSPITCKPYTIPLKYQKFIDGEISLLEYVGYISKILS